MNLQTDWLADLCILRKRKVIGMTERFELVIAAEGGRCMTIFSSNSIVLVRKEADRSVRDWMKAWRVKKMHLWILEEGKIIENIFLE